MKKQIKAWFTRVSYDSTIPRYRLVKLVNAVTLPGIRVSEVVSEAEVRQFENDKTVLLTIQ